MPLSISGLSLSRTSSRTLSIGEGAARDSTDSENIGVPIGESRSIDLEDSGEGGLDTGTVAANSSYAVYLCHNSGPAFGIASLDFDSPSVSGGTVFRRVGAVATDASGDIHDFTQTGSSNTRTYTYDGVQSTLQVVEDGTETSFTTFDMAPLYAISSDKCALRVEPDGASVTVRPEAGKPTRTVTAPETFPFTGADDAASGDYKNDSAGGSADIYVVGFEETV